MASKICGDFQTADGCPLGDSCDFTHIRVCTHYNRASGCKHGSSCKYPHIRVCSDWVLAQENASGVFASQNSASNFAAAGGGDLDDGDVFDGCPNGDKCPRLHMKICRAYISPNGCTKHHCPLHHWILPPRFSNSPDRGGDDNDDDDDDADNHDRDDDCKGKRSGGGKRRKQPDPFAVDPAEVVQNMLDEQQQRQRREAASAIDSTIEILLPGVAAIVDLAQASESVLAALMQIPGAAGGQAAPSVLSDSKAAAAAAAANAIPLLLALDFHNIIDIVQPDQPIGPPSTPKVVCSYVGATGKMRDATRASIQQRMALGQVHMGILVFKKLRASTLQENTRPASFFVASKRHAVELLLKYNPRVAKCLFVDDGEDNTAVVQSTSDKRVSTLLFKQRTAAELNAALSAKIKTI